MDLAWHLISLGKTSSFHFFRDSQVYYIYDTFHELRFLIGVNMITELMLIYHQLDTQEQISVKLSQIQKFSIKIRHFDGLVQ